MDLKSLLIKDLMKQKEEKTKNLKENLHLESLRLQKNKKNFNL